MEVSADTDDLGRFVDRGVAYLAALETIFSGLDTRRAATVAALGGEGPSRSARAPFEELLNEVTTVNGFVDTVRDALVSFDGGGEAAVTVASGTIDWALDRARLDVTGDDLSPAADRTVAARVGVEGTDQSVVEAGAAHQRVVGRIDNGDDLGMSNGELNQVHDRLKELSATELTQVVANLNRQQLERLFHNVHSSGFWSNDWDDGERTAFYDTLSHIPADAKQRLGAYSPYLEALALAEDATAANPITARALDRFSEVDGFRTELNFEERSAVLHQAANYPDTESIYNLGRLSEHHWFQDFELEDQQRTAKMVAFLSQFEAGDEAVIDNTLDLFLLPEAPYTFDWDQDGRAYGSAGGDTFHFNRLYLDDGDGAVGSSDDTEHMVTHTVAHEVNHLINEDDVEKSFDYFMGEYRAYWVGHLAEHGSPPTRADVEDRVTYMLTATTNAYRHIADALDDPVEGPLIAAFVEDIVGRPVTAGDVATELSAGVTDPALLAPRPVAVDGGPNNLDNSAPVDGR